MSLGAAGFLDGLSPILHFPDSEGPPTHSPHSKTQEKTFNHHAAHMTHPFKLGKECSLRGDQLPTSGNWTKAAAGYLEHCHVKGAKTIFPSQCCLLLITIVPLN